jgi:1-acyl-sn-glycerol-3-phosphate acyltransferase
VKQLISRFIFWLFGWKVTGTVPTFKKFVVIAAPHTSALDFPLGMLGSYILGVKFRFYGKKELFDGPFGFLFRALGGLPVDRFSKHGVVEQAVKAFESHDEFILALAPEGTRKYVPEFRKGFYYIALGAKVPIVCGFIDFSTKTVGVGPTVYPTGNYEKDVEEIKAFYRTKKGRHPELGVR